MREGQYVQYVKDLKKRKCQESYDLWKVDRFKVTASPDKKQTESVISRWGFVLTLVSYILLI